MPFTDWMQRVREWTRWILERAFIKFGNQAHLPKDTDNSIVRDKEKNKWINRNDEEEDDGGMGNALAPPPPPGTNKFAGGLGKRRGVSCRVDVFASLAPIAAEVAAPPMIPPLRPMMTPMSIPPQQEGAAAAAADAAPQFFNPNLFAGAGSNL